MTKHMKTFEIRVTDTSDNNNFATMEYITQSPEKSADEVIELVGKAVNYQNELEFYNGDKFVVIFPFSDDEGYMYDTYASKQAYEDGDESEYGGQCTGTINDALSMALS